MSPVRTGGLNSASRTAVVEVGAFLPRPYATALAFAGILLLRCITPVAAGFFMKGSLDTMASLDVRGFLTNSLLFIGAYALEAVATTTGALIRVNTLESLAAALRRRFISKTMSMPYWTYERLSRGDLVSRVTADVNECATIFSSLYFVFDLVARAVATIGFVFFISWEMGLAVVGAITFSMIVNGRLNQPLAPASKEYQGFLGRLSAYALNAVEGHMVVKAFTSEAHLERGFRERAEGLRAKAMLLARYISFVVLGAFAGAFGTLLVAFGYGAYLTIAGRITFGAMLASFSSTDYISPLGHLGESLSEFHKSVGAYSRLREVLSAEEDSDLPAGEPAHTVSGGAAASGVFAGDAGVAGQETTAAIRVLDLEYEYVSGTKALRGLSFDVMPGQKVAIVGRSGCGKSTLLKVLAGLYRPDPGKVFVNGLDMAYWRLASVRDRVTYVPQEPFLFAGTIAENLALGLPGGIQGGEEMVPEVRKGLELAHALEFVESSAKGLESDVGERGSLLSGGQRQRLCLARGFLRNTPILLLDEPTSSVDREAEARILAGVSALPLTCLIVTHRFDVAEMADMILVMDGGRLVESGTHGELLDKQGLYWQLFTGETRFSPSPAAETGGVSR